MPFSSGFKVAKTTFFPEQWLASDILEELTKAISKTALVEGENQLVLKNGVSAVVYVRNGLIETFFPKAGPGVLKASEIVGAIP